MIAIDSTGKFAYVANALANNVSVLPNLFSCAFAGVSDEASYSYFRSAVYGGCHEYRNERPTSGAHH
jgi:hypothetical protein